ncbi:unnamed protein product [Adineta ricciae]|uniref:Lysine-specific metallo-endopeptidase domain-containing protein n=1 Tax=Adineta ricciae TaxID=249248 RepID=A0A815P019_ADIRI|nr:unnamed protein product [Adineta ricciae]CAF1442648.1 unnamed protein product [Adineta ricciae]
MQQLRIVIHIIVNVILISYLHCEDLSVNIVPISSRFTTKQDVTINLNYKNKGSKSMLIYKWYLPTEQLFDPLFEVTRDGKSVEYIGPLVKRRSPKTEDMISIGSGQTMSTRVQLSSVYNMTETGNYVIQFKAKIKSTSSSSKIESLSSSNVLDESALESPPIKLFAEGRSNSILNEIQSKLASQSRSTTYSFTSCSSTQQTSIISAIKSAASYSSNCVQYLTKFTLPASSRYTTWFGTYSLNNLMTLRTHFTNINSVLSSKPMSFDCSCQEKNTFAFVYANIPYKIHLCPEFWTSATVGTDSKAGTLVHETSHFTIVAGTKDNAYGQTDAKNLAKKNPTLALNNADNHEYFAENNPALK